MGYAGVENLLDRHGTEGVFAISSLDGYEPHILMILGSRIKDLSSSSTLASALGTGHKPSAARSTLNPVRGGRIAAAVIWNMSVIIGLFHSESQGYSPISTVFYGLETICR